LGFLATPMIKLQSCGAMKDRTFIIADTVAIIMLVAVCIVLVMAIRSIVRTSRCALSPLLRCASASAAPIRRYPRTTSPS
jgi:hypothetical protein